MNMDIPYRIGKAVTLWAALPTVQPQFVQNEQKQRPRIHDIGV